MQAAGTTLQVTPLTGCLLRRTAHNDQEPVLLSASLKGAVGRRVGPVRASEGTTRGWSRAPTRALPRPPRAWILEGILLASYDGDEGTRFRVFSCWLAQPLRLRTSGCGSRSLTQTTSTIGGARGLDEAPVHSRVASRYLRVRPLHWRRRASSNQHVQPKSQGQEGNCARRGGQQTRVERGGLRSAQRFLRSIYMKTQHSRCRAADAAALHWISTVGEVESSIGRQTRTAR